MRAQDLFPDLFTKQTSTSDQTGRGRYDYGCRPLPPDVSWLAKGVDGSGEDEAVRPRQALVVITDGSKRALVARALVQLGFQVFAEQNTQQFAVALAHPDVSLLIGDTADLLPALHGQVLQLPMVRRRMLYYALVGPRLRTLYGLEALSLSANLVVNDADLPWLDKILMKGFKDFEALYGPYLDELQCGSPDFLR